MTRAGQAVQLVRAGYGAALLFAPRPVIAMATGRQPSRRTVQVARLLGARHVAQVALTAAFPYPATAALGAQVDVVHATSMVALAAISRQVRRTALSDAVTEIALAAVTLAVAPTTPQ